VALLGVETTTDDLTGEVTRHTSHLPGDREVEAGLQSLVGTHAQVPPAYSAKHVQGRRAYALARAGEAVDLPAAPVTIHAVTLLARQGPRVTFDVRCGRGTYIRAMARDLGRVLGVGAHLVELRRTAVGPFRAEDGVAPERVAPEACRSPEVLARALPHAEVAGHQARDILHGKDVTAAVVGTLPWAAGSSGVVVGPGGEPLALARANHALAAGDPVAPGTLTLGRRFPSS
jgi:tRNA pseudouridine55 synthase